MDDLVRDAQLEAALTCLGHDWCIRSMVGVYYCRTCQAHMWWNGERNGARLYYSRRPLANATHDGIVPCLK